MPAFMIQHPEMKSHERILATLCRQPVDRVPVDVWLTPEVLDCLLKFTGATEEFELYRKLDVDKIVFISPGYKSENFDPNHSAGMDPWGVATVRVKSGLATYQEYGRGPLADMLEPEELDGYALWPDPAKFNYAAAKTLAQRARQYGFATMGPWVSHYEVYCHMRGMENALMDVAADPDFLEAGLDRIESIQSAMMERCLTELGDLIDIVFVSDDLGTQESQLISLDQWRRHLQPRLARWCDIIHKHGKKVLFHTDGAARNFVEPLIQSGIDILNPIQHICPGMERAGLKKDFGDRVIFYGGVENQHVLPHGSVQEVADEVRTCLETLGSGGGYIPCSCHNVQAGTPPENVLTMIETVQNWKV